MQILHTIALDFSEPVKMEPVPAKQGDDATRYLAVELYDQGERFIIPAGATTRVSLQKPDRTRILTDAEISDNTVLFALTGQMLAVAGMVTVEVQLFLKEKLLSTPGFPMLVQATNYDADELESSSEYQSLAALFEKLKDFDAAQVREELDNLEQGLNSLKQSVTGLETNKAPTNHASTETAYGVGTATNYGHVKLTDDSTTNSNASSGVAATPAGVQAALPQAVAYTNIQNQLINTDCLINQRGVYAAAAGYTYDRWVTSSSSMTVSTQANTSPASCINEIVVTKSGSGYFCQPLESFADNWLGRTVTVSVWLKAAIGTLTVGVGGLTQAVTRTGDWQLVQLTGTVSTYSTWYRKGFYVYSSSGTVYLAAPQVVFGSYIGAYQPRLMADDLALCQRFYYKTNGNRVFGYTQANNSATYVCFAQLTFPVTMRTAPTISYTSGQLSIRGQGTTVLANSLSTEVFYGNGISLQATCAGPVGNSHSVSGWFADTPTSFDAEITS